MITYRIADCKGKTTYGIIALDSDGVEVAKIDDISANKKAVTELSELMNREQLSLIPFRDAVDDFLISQY